MTEPLSRDSFTNGDDLFPPEPVGLEPLHDREYRVRAYRKSDDLVLVRAAVRDLQAPGLYDEHDTEPIAVHHMVIELDVTYPELVIVRADVVFETHPHETCPEITPRYERLVGMSLARQFVGEVRAQFGGASGCAHLLALLQAIRPAAIQFSWAMTVSRARRKGAPMDEILSPRPHKSIGWGAHYDTCHVWARDGEFVRSVEGGSPIPVPIPVRRRVDERERTNVDPAS